MHTSKYYITFCRKKTGAVEKNHLIFRYSHLLDGRKHQLHPGFYDDNRCFLLSANCVKRTNDRVFLLNLGV
ncbi:hypothetical protein BaLi_c15050 [Bacillus paralicheniformis ATCC 9945a]|nr:hypothetical protein BaLi_c15050 [Bacillus paralicheniformis ATCC 9945a]